MAAKRDFLVRWKCGFHARPLAKVVRYVKEYSGEVSMDWEDQQGNLKSILQVMAMGIPCGAQITICVSGPEEERFADELLRFMEEIEG